LKGLPGEIGFNRHEDGHEVHQKEVVLSDPSFYHIFVG
jgi:hypothetical protein